jgi:arginyl-tRNA synthetase
MEQNLSELILTKINNIFGSETCNSNAKITVEVPKNKEHGDFATNAALVLTKTLKTKPRDIAEKIKSKLEQDPIFTKIEIAGPGFVNFTLSESFYQNHLGNIYNNLKEFGSLKIGSDVKINIEFGSPNPTGPVHVGHSRSLIIGSALANLLEFSGYEVTRENYFNDAGGQIDILAKSLYIRYQEILLNKSIDIPKGLYPGNYLIDIAKDLIERDGDKYLNMDESDYLPILKNFATDKIKKIIIKSFANINVRHDINSSELKLHQENKIQESTNFLKDLNLLYYGELEKPKGFDSKNSNSSEQMLLFKSTEFGDDMDRSLQKSDESWTYFAADIAYHKDKIDRGYDKLILLLGADHGGYTKRITAAVKALSNNKVECITILCQLVNFVKDGQPLKMSKRAGNYITMDDVVEQIGSDALRLLMLSRKNDTVFDFDLSKALEQSKDNPVFYIQYAHARICSVIRNIDIDISDIKNDYLKHLTDKSECDLIKKISALPQIVFSATKNFEPHQLVNYIYELAGEFHSYWNLGKNRSEMRLIHDNREITQARIILLLVIKDIIAKILNIFSIKALDKME